MTKIEFLADLASKNWCVYVGTPELLETKDDGANWYAVNIRDESGKVGGYQNIHFYVVDEGGAGETALYKDHEPLETQNTISDLKRWMLDAVDVNPNNYKGIQILWTSERWDMVIYNVLEGSPLEQVTYYIRRGNGAPVVISNFDIELLKSIFRI